MAKTSVFIQKYSNLATCICRNEKTRFSANKQLLSKYASTMAWDQIIKNLSISSIKLVGLMKLGTLELFKKKMNKKDIIKVFHI